MSNLEVLLNKYSLGGWDWYVLSLNEGISEEYFYNTVCTNPWNWFNISKNASISLEFIKKNIHLPWDYTGLSFNPNVNNEFVRTRVKSDWGWYNLSQNPGISIEFIYSTLDTKNYNWNYYSIFLNPNMTQSSIEKFKKLFKSLKSHISIPYSYFFKNSYSVTLDFIKEYTVTHILPLYKLITLQSDGSDGSDRKNKYEIRERINVFFDDLSGCKLVNIDFVLLISNLFSREKVWNWYFLSQNPGIKVTDVEKYPHLEWCWSGLSRNPSLTIDFILKYPNEKWNWSLLSQHQNITLEIIKLNQHLKWCWSSVSSNPNLTLYEIQSLINTSHISFSRLSRNAFRGGRGKKLKYFRATKRLDNIKILQVWMSKSIRKERLLILISHVRIKDLCKMILEYC